VNAGGQRFTGDDGRPDPRVAAVLARYAAGQEAEQAALAALAVARLLIPLVEREATGPADTGSEARPRAADGPGPGEPADPHPAPACRTAGSAPGREMAFPTLIGRDGRPALLAFTSLEALTRWRPGARPVPALAVQVFQTAVADSCAVVVDVAGPVPLAVDGARLAALAQGEPPPAPQDDPDVHAQIAEALAGEPAISGAELSGGGDGTDLAVRLMIRPRATTLPDVQRVAEAIAARLAGRLRRGIEVAAMPGTRVRR
jgi:hypothetical protein